MRAEPRAPSVEGTGQPAGAATRGAHHDHHPTSPPPDHRRATRRGAVAERAGSDPQRRRDRRPRQHRPPARALRDPHHPAARHEPAGRRRRRLDERYVREWLGGVVAAGFVDYDPDGRTYALRPEHAPFLTGPAPTTSPGRCGYIDPDGPGHPEVVDMLPRRAAGSPTTTTRASTTSRPPRARPSTTPSLIDTIIPLTGLVDRLRDGIDVADIGCGEGHAINLLAREFPRSRFTGFDFSARGPRRGPRRGGRLGPDQRHLRERDVAALPTRRRSTWSRPSTRSTTRPTRPTVLAAIRRALRARRHVPHGRHQRLEPPRGQRRPAVGAASSTPSRPCTACRSRSARAATGWAPSGACSSPSGCCATPASPTVDAARLEDDPFNAYFVARP